MYVLRSFASGELLEGQATALDDGSDIYGADDCELRVLSDYSTDADISGSSPLWLVDPATGSFRVLGAMQQGRDERHGSALIRSYASGAVARAQARGPLTRPNGAERVP